MNHVRSATGAVAHSCFNYGSYDEGLQYSPKPVTDHGQRCSAKTRYTVSEIRLLSSDTSIPLFGELIAHFRITAEIAVHHVHCTILNKLFSLHCSRYP